MPNLRFPVGVGLRLPSVDDVIDFRLKIQEQHCTERCSSPMRTMLCSALNKSLYHKALLDSLRHHGKIDPLPIYNISECMHY